MTLIMKRWDQFGWLALMLAGLSTGLYYFWFRHLSSEVKID